LDHQNQQKILRILILKNFSANHFYEKIIISGLTLGRKKINIEKCAFLELKTQQ